MSQTLSDALTQTPRTWLVRSSPAIEAVYWTALWPVGSLEYSTPKGEHRAGVVCITARTNGVEIELLPADAQVLPAPQGDRHLPEPSTNKVLHDAFADAINRALQLAQLMVAEEQAVMGYTKPGKPTERRTLTELRPGGRLVYAHDCDRDALRSFRLDRIDWVQPAEPTE